jgi:hypothetical protein
MNSATDLEDMSLNPLGTRSTDLKTLGSGLSTQYNQNEFLRSFCDSFSSTIFYIQHGPPHSGTYFWSTSRVLLSTSHNITVPLSVINVQYNSVGSTSVQNNWLGDTCNIAHYSTSYTVLFSTVYNIFMIAICKTLYSVYVVCSVLNWQGSRRKYFHNAERLRQK